jgi:hypothetical protein
MEEEEPTELGWGVVARFFISIGIIWIMGGLVDRNNNTMMQPRQVD